MEFRSPDFSLLFVCQCVPGIACLCYRFFEFWWRNYIGAPDIWNWFLGFKIETSFSYHRFPMIALQFLDICLYVLEINSYLSYLCLDLIVTILLLDLEVREELFVIFRVLLGLFVLLKYPDLNVSNSPKTLASRSRNCICATTLLKR